MTPIQFRMDKETLAMLDKLKESLAFPSRAAVVRLAIRRMARTELGEVRKQRKGK